MKLLIFLLMVTGSLNAQTMCLEKSVDTTILHTFNGIDILGPFTDFPMDIEDIFGVAECLEIGSADFEYICEVLSGRYPDLIFDVFQQTDGLFVFRDKTGIHNYSISNICDEHEGVLLKTDINGILEAMFLKPLRKYPCN